MATPLTTDAMSQSNERTRARRGATSRFIVHLGLLLSLAGAFGTLQLLHVRNAIHADIGLTFAALVLVHLAQRRHRIARMVPRVRRRIERELRLLTSDAILAFLTINVVLSGIIDWERGNAAGLPLPRPFSRWHLTSSALLVVYLVAHIARRWRRIRRSTVR